MQNSPPSPSVASLYQQAYTFHRNSQFAEAASLYQHIIALQANHADAHHMLGLVCYQTNRAAEAITHITKALSITPRKPDYLNNLGLALRADNQHEAALKSFQQAILLQPKDLDVQLNLANTESHQ
jgi:protein O-GlcNAc transferase